METTKKDKRHLARAVAGAYDSGNSPGDVAEYEKPDQTGVRATVPLAELEDDWAEECERYGLIVRLLPIAPWSNNEPIDAAIVLACSVLSLLVLLFWPQLLINMAILVASFLVLWSFVNVGAQMRQKRQRIRVRSFYGLSPQSHWEQLWEERLAVLENVYRQAHRKMYGLETDDDDQIFLARFNSLKAAILKGANYQQAEAVRKRERQRFLQIVLECLKQEPTNRLHSGAPAREPADQKEQSH